jgi:hypothetical protein
MKKDSPYTAGIADGLKCVGMIKASNLATRNRIAFLTLDSIFEIALRIYLQHVKKVRLDPNTHRPRHTLVAVAQKNITVDDSVWEHVNYCYGAIRCPLYHEASDMTVTDAMLDDFAETVSFLMNTMFGIAANDLIEEGRRTHAVPDIQPPVALVNPNTLPNKVDAIILSVGQTPAGDSRAVVEHLKSLGFTKKLTTKEVSAYLSQGKYFYKDPTDEIWKLTSAVGRVRFEELTKPQAMKGDQK